MTRTTVIGWDGAADGGVGVGCVGGVGPSTAVIFLCGVWPHPKDMAASRRMGSNFLSNWISFECRLGRAGEYDRTENPMFGLRRQGIGSTGTHADMRTMTERMMIRDQRRYRELSRPKSREESQEDENSSSALPERSLCHSSIKPHLRRKPVANSPDSQNVKRIGRVSFQLLA